MLPITKEFLTNRRTRPALRDREWYTIRKLKGVVMHWTANEGIGADAMGNRQYFNTTNRFASAHYIVDDKSIVQCLPDDEVGYHVGSRYYKPFGEAIMEDDLTPNYFLLGIEMCVNADGDWNKTYQNSVHLAQHLLNKYSFTLRDLYRHYDITGKDCPKMMIKESDWQKFRGEVNVGLTHSLGNSIKSGEINTMDLNVRTGNGIEFPVVAKMNIGDPVQIYEELGNWFRIGDNQWVHKHYVKITFTRSKGIVNDPTGLNVRSGPGVQHGIVEVIKDNTTIDIFNKKDKWYNIGHNKWVYAPLVNLIQERTGKVTAPAFLNVRKGPGTQFPIVKKLQSGALVKVTQEQEGWLQVGNDEWVFHVFVEILD